MEEVKFINKTIKDNLDVILDYNTEAKEGNVSGFSIEVMEGDSYSSYVYYDDKESRDKDLIKLNKLLNG